MRARSPRTQHHVGMDSSAGRAPAAVVLALSTGVAVLALVTARGVTPLGGDSYATEFISGWWWAAFLLVPLTVAAVRRWPGPAAVPVLALVLPQVVAAAVAVGRFRAAGWADGLEGLAFVHPLLLTAVTVGLLALRRRSST
jgi:hypothetical protein